MAESIGERIKEQRIEKGLTLAELGEKTNLSISYLSQIERDKTLPSLVTLAEIAKALDTGMRYFFEAEKELVLVVRSDKRADLNPLDQPVSHYPLMPQDGVAKITVHKIIIQSHAGYEEISPCKGEEVIFVLKGELSITVGDMDYILQEGDSVHYDAVQPHSWKNNLDEVCVILWSRALSISEPQNRLNSVIEEK